MAKTQTNQGGALAAVKAQYGLEELNSEFYNKGFQLNWVQQLLHAEYIKAISHGHEIAAVNLMAGGIRLQESLIANNLDDDDYSYIMILREDFDNLPLNDISGRLTTLFLRYDFINDRLNQTMVDKKFYAPEGDHGGILSDLISTRISLHDQNFIVGIHGLPRSGKSRAAGRVGVNTNKKVEDILGSKVGFAVEDWVYTKEEYLRRLKERQKAGTLKGSVIVLEEAGDMLNSQRFWDKDVIGSVDILRQQGYQNTCLIIVSQLHSDVVRKARGLFHMVLVPWKDYRKRTVELEDFGNIDFDKGLSYWKIDLLDVDPMTGDAYPQGIRVALGRVKKLGVTMPPVKLDRAYDKKDADHKDRKLNQQYNDTIKENLQAGKPETLLQCAQEVLAYKDKYILPSGKWRTSRIGNHYGVGGRLAVKIRDKADELLTQQKPKEEAKEDAKKTETTQG